jgi:hypothetical protein
MCLDHRKLSKKKRIKLYNTLPLPFQLCHTVVKIGPKKARDARRITQTEMKYMRKKTAGYAWTDCKANTATAKELNTNSVLDKIREYRRHWKRNENRMPRKRLPRIIKNYRPKGRRNQGRPILRLLDV